MPTQEEIWAAIQELGRALGVGAEYVWEAIQQQVLVDATLMGLAAVLLFAVAAVLLGPFRRAEIEQTGDGTGSLTIGLIVPAIGLFLSGCAIARLINPSWYAIQKVLNLF